MELNLQKRLAAQIMKCSPKRVCFDVDRIADIKEAITKVDIRALINDNAITKKNSKGISKVRSRKIKCQKRKGRRRGVGSRKGKKTARLSRKASWIHRIRAQRKMLLGMRDKREITKTVYRELYLKAKGGFFRSRRHISLYIEEHNLIANDKNEKK